MSKRVDKMKPLLFALAILAAAAPARAGGGCQGTEVPWIGAEVLRCPGGTCSYSRWQSQATGVGSGGSRAATYDFTTEPRLFAIRADGPAAGLLEEGDALVAVNGYMITSPRGGRELALLEEGVAVDLLVRRDDRIVDVSIVPEVRCGPPAITTGESGAKIMMEASATSGPSGITVSIPALGIDPAEGAGGFGELGMALSAGCDGCTISVEGEEGAGSGTTSMTIQVRELFSQAQSLEVSGVREGGAAWRAGLRPGDRVVRVDGKDVGSKAALDILMDPRAGQRLLIEYERGGEQRSAWLTVDRAVATTGISVSSASIGYSEGGYTMSGTAWGVGNMGLLFEFCPGCTWGREPDGALAWNIDRPLSVVEVDRGSPADEAGLREGDVVTHVNGHKITTLEAGLRIVDAEPGDWLELRYRRQGRVRTTTLKLPPRPGS